MRLRSLPRTSFVFSLPLLLALVAPARADKAVDARTLFEAGNTHFAVGEFEAAGEKYQEAYKLKPDAALLYNAAQAFRLAGKVDRALVLYKNYVLFYPKARNIDEVRKVIVSLEEARTSVEKAKTAPPVDTAQVGSDRTRAKQPDRVATTSTTTATQPRTTTSTATTTPPPTTPPPDDTGTTTSTTTSPDRGTTTATTTTTNTTTASTTPAKGETKTSDSTPVYKKWWLWTIVGVAVVGVGVGLGVGLSQKGEPWATNPQIGPGAALLSVGF